MIPQDPVRQAEVELRKTLHELRYTDGLQKVVEYAMLQQQRSMKMLLRCEASEVLKYQSEHAAMQRVIDAINKPVAVGE